MRGENLWLGGEPSGWERAYGWSGGGSGYKSDVWVDDDGSRVAVYLLNARHFDTAQPQPTRPNTTPSRDTTAAPER